MMRMKVMSEARFLAGEDARGVLVVLEPETALTDEHLSALLDCGAAGFVSDFTEERFEKPDVVPELVYDRARYATLRAFAVTPRQGVHIRTVAWREPECFAEVSDDGALTLVEPTPRARRDKSNDPEIGKAAIRAALDELGVRKGDALMVHSSLSACGRIVGGARTVIEALIEAVGEDGNVFFPTYQRASCFLNGAINRRWDHRPSDVRARDSESIRWVGTIPIEFMRLYPDAPRGVHISHSWTGWGKRAAEVLSHQTWDEPAFSANSAPYKIMEMGGKILHFGSPICRTSFIHCLENVLNLQGYGGTGLYQVMLPDGKMTWKAVPGAFCGRRETTLLNEEARYYKAAKKEGLRIDRVALGRGTLMLMDARNYWDVGVKIFTKDPLINLC